MTNALARRLLHGLFCCVLLLALGKPAWADNPALGTHASALNDNQFTVIIDQAVDSKSARPGDIVSGHLGSHLCVGGHDFPPGSPVVGHVTEVEKARRALTAEVCPKRWLHADGGIGIAVDEVDDWSGERAAICGIPAPMSKDFRNGVQEKSIVVSKTGVVQPSRTSEIAPKLTRTAIGVASMLHSPVVPLAGGLIGALAPSLVLASTDKEYQSEVKHRRLKGFAVGMISGVPGGFLINDCFLKGRDEVVRPGTVLLMRLQGGENATCSAI